MVDRRANRSCRSTFSVWIGSTTVRLAFVVTVIAVTGGVVVSAFPTILILRSFLLLDS